MPNEWQPCSELPDLRHVGIVAIDTETNDEGLRLDRGSGWPWGGGYIAGISLAWRADGVIRAIYVSLRHPDSQNFEREQVIRWLQDLIASDVRFITHNALYDWGVAAGRSWHCNAPLRSTRGHQRAGNDH
jgi:hypothetical protein